MSDIIPGCQERTNFIVQYIFCLGHGNESHRIPSEDF